MSPKSTSKYLLANIMRMKIDLLSVASSAVNAASKPETLDSPAKGSLNKQPVKISQSVAESIEAKATLFTKSKQAVRAAFKAKVSLAIRKTAVDNVIISEKRVPR